MKVIDIMKTGPVIPVIVVQELEDAVPLCRALVEGGIRVLELTLRTPMAIQAIEAVAREVPDAIVGVGTITKPEDFARTMRAGARFGVTPGLTPLLAKAAHDSGMPLLPGVMTPTDVIHARSEGFHELKLFPAQQAGGLGMLKALSGPFPDVRFCPTGGVSMANAHEFLSLPNVACVGGSWLTPADVVARKDWGRIRELAAEAVRLRTA